MKKWLGALTALVMCGGLAYGASIPLLSGPQYSEPSQILATVNFLIQQINTLVTPQTMASWSNPRNILDNGGMQVAQRGTAAQTCGTTTIPSSAYSADRWGCNVNVTSGAGSLQVVTTNLPSQPVFNDALLFYRTSGALAQPQCVMQEIPTTRIVPLQGQAVTLSFYAYGLANMLAEQTTLNAYLFTGTGTDQGLQSFTASPAITPAWTGIASSQTTAFTLTANWQRFTATYQIPAAAKEAAVALCWTPTVGGTAGATDGFEFTGVQLEQGASASAFEYRTVGDELQVAQRYYWQWAETVSSTADSPFMCAAQSTTVAVCKTTTHVAFRVAPTITCTPGTIKRQVAGTDTAVTACAAAATTNGVSGVDNVTITATVASGDTAGLAGTMMSGNSTGGGLVTASADF
jgi:hypothetical protein